MGWSIDGARLRRTRRLKIVEESGPVEDVEWDEREREEKSRHGVDLTDAVNLPCTGRHAAELPHAFVAASTGRRTSTQAVGDPRPHAATAPSAPPRLGGGAERRRTGVVETSAAHHSRQGRRRRLRFAVDVLRRRQRTLNRFARGATVARLCRTLFNLLQAVVQSSVAVVKYKYASESMRDSKLLGRWGMKNSQLRTRQS